MTKAQKEAARERMAKARAAKAAKAKVRELVVLYRNGEEQFTKVTPLRFTQGNAALQFANILAEMFPAYEFVVAIEKGPSPS